MRHASPVAAPYLLLGLAGAVICADLAWAATGRFDIDTAAYVRLGLLSLVLFAGSLFYRTRRPDPQLAAMLFGAGFLCAFSAGASVLNYFLLTVAGPRIDVLLAQADAILGFDWYRGMVAMSRLPLLNALFYQVYNLVLPQIALLLVLLAWSGRVEQVYRFCAALAVGALVAIAIWTLVPSLGAKSLYTLPAEVAARLKLSIDCEYGRALTELLHNGPGRITPADLRGLIAFPSYHAVLALILIWYGRHFRVLRWPVLGLNVLVLISTPFQGGHHLVDVLGGFPVAAFAIVAARRICPLPSRVPAPAFAPIGSPLPGAPEAQAYPSSAQVPLRG